HPLLACLALILFEAASGRLQHSARNGARMSDQPQVDITVLADSAVVHVDLHQLELGADAAAVTHTEIKRSPDDDDHIRFREGVASSAIEVMRVSRRQQSAATPVEVAGNVEATQERNRLLVAARRP